MSITILEVLQNAEYNLRHDNSQIIKGVGLEQLQNAIWLMVFLDHHVTDDFIEEDINAPALREFFDINNK